MLILRSKEVVNPFSREEVRGEENCSIFEYEIPLYFKRDKFTSTLRRITQVKKLQFSYDKRVIVNYDTFETKPFGYRKTK